MEQVCPYCGTIMPESATVCRECGRPLRAAAVNSSARNAGGGSGMWAIAGERLGPILKIVAVVAVLALLGWLVWRGIYATVCSSERDPHPTSPVATAQEFFTALQQQDYQKCYSLLIPSRHMATGVGLQSRDTYFNHFDRIRRYLVKRVGDNFTTNMQVSGNGQVVTFAHGIELRIKYGTNEGADSHLHYGIDDFLDFPIDVAPGLGLEAHNRMVNQFIDDLESGRQRHKKETNPVTALVDTFRNSRQLDTRHDLLEYLIQKYPDDPRTYDLLKDIARDPQQPAQLRTLAQQHLPPG